jgi:hypothetical protein
LNNEPTPNQQTDTITTYAQYPGFFYPVSLPVIVSAARNFIHYLVDKFDLLPKLSHFKSM